MPMPFPPPPIIPPQSNWYKNQNQPDQPASSPVPANNQQQDGQILQRNLAEQKRRATDPAYLKQAAQTKKFLDSPQVSQQPAQPGPRPAFSLLNAIHSIFQSIHGAEQGTQNFIKFMQSIFAQK